nr:MAG TPA: hypothetical protein [Caudoviricetes sp.]
MYFCPAKIETDVSPLQKMELFFFVSFFLLVVKIFVLLSCKNRD